LENEPVKVSLIGKGKNNFYQIKFSHLQIPVNINEELYQKMLVCPEYQFENTPNSITNKLSARNNINLKSPNIFGLFYSAKFLMFIRILLPNL